MVRLIPVNAMSRTKKASDGMEYRTLQTVSTGAYTRGHRTHARPRGNAMTRPSSDAPSAMTR